MCHLKFIALSFLACDELLRRKVTLCERGLEVVVQILKLIFRDVIGTEPSIIGQEDVIPCGE